MATRKKSPTRPNAPILPVVPDQGEQTVLERQTQKVEPPKPVVPAAKWPWQNQATWNNYTAQPAKTPEEIAEEARKQKYLDFRGVAKHKPFRGKSLTLTCQDQSLYIEKYFGKFRDFSSSMICISLRQMYTKKIIHQMFGGLFLKNRVYLFF